MFIEEASRSSLPIFAFMLDIDNDLEGSMRDHEHRPRLVTNACTPRTTASADRRKPIRRFRSRA
jgi:hypothetical protein